MSHVATQNIRRADAARCASSARRRLSLRSMLLLAGAALSLGASGCAKQTQLLSKYCRAASDQTASFKGKAESVPFTVLVDKDFGAAPDADFNPSEMAERWNAMGRNYGYEKLFDVVYNQTVPTAVKDGTVNICNAPAIQGTATTFYLVQADTTSWTQLALNSGTQGSTIQCISGQRIERQAVYVNPTTTIKEQINSVILHEFGHALGLNHSCASGLGDDQAKSGYGSCDGLAVDHPYRVASMYPILSLIDPFAVSGTAPTSVSSPLSQIATIALARKNGLGSLFAAMAGVSGTNGANPEIKETLTENDLMRGECLYRQD